MDVGNPRSFLTLRHVLGEEQVRDCSSGFDHAETLAMSAKFLPPAVTSQIGRGRDARGQHEPVQGFYGVLWSRANENMRLAMNFEEGIHVRPPQVCVCWKIYDEVVQERQSLHVVPLGNELLADNLHSHVEMEQEQAAVDSMVREENVLFGRVARDIELQTGSNLLEAILYDTCLHV